jgi:hypothetical protein
VILSAAAVFACFAVAGLGLWLLPRLTTSVRAEGEIISPSATASGGGVSDEVAANIEARLRQVGLADANYLQNTGVATHIRRLRNNEIGPDELLAMLTISNT